MPDALIRQDEVQRRVGLSRTTIWRLEKRGLFPRRRQVIGGVVAWLESELNEWIVNRPVADAEQPAA